MIFGIGGYAYSGKDTVAEILEKEHGFFNAGSFSVGLNETLLVLNPIVGAGPTYGSDSMRYRELFELKGGYAGYSEFKAHPEVRRLLQVMGTEVGRNMISRDVWIMVMEQRLREAFDADRDIAITGVRYLNEAAWVRATGGRLIWIERPGYGPVNEHSSDNSLEPHEFDALLSNSSTIDELRVNVAWLKDSFSKKDETVA